MATLSFIIGIFGSLILVTGAAWPEKKKKKSPLHSIKNWLLAAGGAIMLIYAIFTYLAGSPVFFVFLQTLIVIASILMMLNTDDRIDMTIILASALILIIWSLCLSNGINTIIFIIGLTAIGLGYAFQAGTIRRGLALTLGSGIIAAFSYLESNWIFFGLNTFFSIFSAYYLIKRLNVRK